MVNEYDRSLPLVRGIVNSWRRIRQEDLGHFGVLFLIFLVKVYIE
jgi:hypothetical protein